MPEIPEIGVGRIGVPEIPTWRGIPPQSIPQEPPITLMLGFPVGDIPGCVETRNSQPGNADAYTTDPKGNFTVCDGTMPSFPAALDFTPGTLTYGSAKPPVIDPKEKPAASKQPAKSPSPAESPLAGVPNVDTELPCPPPDAIPIGAKNKLQTAVITGYKRVDGECKTQFKSLDIPTILGNHLPGSPVVVTTATIAVVATTAAVLAKPLGDILLKVIKPTVKKTIKKIKEKLGKKVPIESAWQRRKFQRSLKK
ncbi:hypothetical protein [uncultured Mediterranean phage uvMED]|nr:hypothetical protein [uncultured Mediterranean phage uvMED]